MTRVVVWIVVLVVVALVVDRVLLRLEARGWINYRTTGLSRTGPIYHALELHSIFDPGAEEIQEIVFREERQEDLSGDTNDPEGDGPPP